MIFAVTITAVVSIAFGFIVGALYATGEFEHRLNETVLDFPEWAEQNDAARKIYEVFHRDN